MTGTHPHSVGLDYIKMMDKSENSTLQTKGESGILAKEIQHLAKMHGFDLLASEEAKLIKCELDDYHTLDCFKQIEGGNEVIFAVYNPNLDPLHGLFIKVERLHSNIKVHMLTSSMFNGDSKDIKSVEDMMKQVKIEVLCTM